MFKIYDFTKSELEQCREECNFTEQEMKCFDLKARNKSAVQIADEMHISTTTVCNITKRIRIKVDKVMKDVA